MTDLHNGSNGNGAGAHAPSTELAPADVAELMRTAQALTESLSVLMPFVNRLMTGYEAAHRRIVDAYDLQANRLDKSEGAVTRALEMQLRTTEEYEKLASLRHERELNARLSQAKTEALHSMTKDLRSLGTVAAKRLLGVPLTGDDSHGLQDLLATFDDKQIEDAMTTGEVKLSDGQRNALAMVFGSLADKEAKDHGDGG